VCVLINASIDSSMRIPKAGTLVSGTLIPFHLDLLIISGSDVPAISLPTSGIKLAHQH